MFGSGEGGTPLNKWYKISARGQQFIIGSCFILKKKIKYYIYLYLKRHWYMENKILFTNT